MVATILLNKKYNYTYFPFPTTFNISEFNEMSLHVHYVPNLSGFCFLLLYMIPATTRRTVRSRNSNAPTIPPISACDRKNPDSAKYQKNFLVFNFLFVNM